MSASENGGRAAITTEETAIRAIITPEETATRATNTQIITSEIEPETATEAGGELLKKYTLLNFNQLTFQSNFRHTDWPQIDGHVQVHYLI